MIHQLAVMCCLVAAACGSPQGYAYGGRKGNYGQASALPRKFSVSKYQAGAQYQGGAQYKGGAQYQGAGQYQGGYSGAGQYSTEDPYAEPANYDFAYEVNAPEYNVQFGHQESRRDMAARGSYSVLLPDGRTQLVEYEADQDGYRPVITYQGTAGIAGYGQAGNGYGGYSSKGSANGKSSYGQKSYGSSSGYQTSAQGRY